MTVSVLIPVYNGGRTIQATLDSVLQQTVPADEILVMDDGSTDDTFSLLQSYTPRVQTFRQKNTGVAAARNALCARATGEFIAFLDSDDLWHPRYLEYQAKRFRDHPDAVAFIAGHDDFHGYGNYEWKSKDSDFESGVEALDSLDFFKRLNASPWSFLPSFLCVPAKVLAAFNGAPFYEKVGGVEDGYFLRRLALIGNVIVAPAPLVAYRIHRNSISQNALDMCRFSVECYQALDEYYRSRPEKGLYQAFKMAFASEHRQYAKRLMGTGKTREARQQLLLSLSVTNSPLSAGKSLGFLLVSYMPPLLQPDWPPPHREWRSQDQQ